MLHLTELVSLYALVWCPHGCQLLAVKSHVAELHEAGRAAERVKGTLAPWFHQRMVIVLPVLWGTPDGLSPKLAWCVDVVNLGKSFPPLLG